MDAKDVVDTVKSGAQYMKDKIMGTDAQNAKASAEMKEQDARNPDSVQAKINKVVGYKKGGSMEHKHNVDHVKKHYESAGHTHEQDKVSKHKETHKMHHEHVKAMCMGGKAKK